MFFDVFKLFLGCENLFVFELNLFCLGKMGEEKGWREVVERGSYFFSKEKIFESSPINTLSKVEEDDESGAEGTTLVKRKWVWSKDQWQTRALPLVKTLFCFGGLAGAVVGIRRFFFHIFIFLKEKNSRLVVSDKKERSTLWVTSPNGK